MNVIFLDIDGVFVTHRSWLGSKVKRSGRLSEFDPIALEMVRKLCEKNSAKIVVSSTWRKISVMEPGEDYKNILFNHFNDSGLFEYVLMPSWRTVCLGFEKRSSDMPSIENWKKWTDRKDLCVRGDEIDRWLKINGQDVKNYCIIDDEYDFTDFQIENHLVQTDFEEGFLYKHYRLAEKILTKNP